MKKTFFLSLLSAVLLTTFSCSNDFDVAAPWKDIPVVYGLLNVENPVHYIRVEKAFLDPDANALELAKIADSLYYDNAIVQLERVNTGEVFTLRLDSLPREDGVFATSPNLVYAIDSGEIKLRQGDQIRLRIDRQNGLPEVTATTFALSAGKIRNPNPSVNSQLDFRYNLDTKLSWSGDARARIFDAKMTIRFAEIEDGEVTEKSLEWIWGRGIRNENAQTEISIEKQGREFFELLKNNLQASSSISRVFQGIDIEILAGGEALEDYINVASANTGITGSSELPTFSNLSEGRGVFSSISYLKTTNVLLSQRTRDSLENGMITKDLNF